MRVIFFYYWYCFRFIHPNIDKFAIVLCTEVCKIAIAAFTFSLLPKEKVQQVFRNWSVLDSVTTAGLPAVLYVIQNILVLHGYDLLDSVTFNVLNQTKVKRAFCFCSFCLMLYLDALCSFLAIHYIRIATVSRANYSAVVTAHSCGSAESLFRRCWQCQWEQCQVARRCLCVGRLSPFRVFRSSYTESFEYQQQRLTAFLGRIGFLRYSAAARATGADPPGYRGRGMEYAHIHSNSHKCIIGLSLSFIYIMECRLLEELW